MCHNFSSSVQQIPKLLFREKKMKKAPFIALIMPSLRALFEVKIPVHVLAW